MPEFGCKFSDVARSVRFASATRGSVLWFFFGLLSVLLPTVAAFVAFAPRTGYNNTERVVMGGLCRHESVMQAGWNVGTCSYSACFLSVEGEECFCGYLCCRCRTQSTDVLALEIPFLCAAAA